MLTNNLAIFFSGEILPEFEAKNMEDRPWTFVTVPIDELLEEENINHRLEHISREIEDKCLSISEEDPYLFRTKSFFFEGPHDANHICQQHIMLQVAVNKDFTMFSLIHNPNEHHHSE